jgi:hypothetical protein
MTRLVFISATEIASSSSESLQSDHPGHLQLLNSFLFLIVSFFHSLLRKGIAMASQRVLNRSTRPLALVCAASILCTGCASIVSPGPDKVSFNSRPPGATVVIDGVKLGQTPITAQVRRKAQYATFVKDGYEESKVPVDRHLNGWIFGNILFGGIIGIVVDVATNNHMKAEKSQQVDLRRSATAGVGQHPPVSADQSQSSARITPQQSSASSAE